YDNNRGYVLAKTTTGTSYTFSNLSAGSNVYYRVRAYITKNGVTYYGDFSSTYHTSTKPAQTTKLTATQTSSSITLSWNKVSGATGYRIYVYDSKKDEYVKLTDVKGTKYTVKKISGKKLKEGTTYKFAIKPYFSGSKTVWCSTFKYLSTATEPGKPTLKVTAATKKAALKWSKENCTGYVIYMKTGKNGEYKKVATVNGKSKTSYTVKKLKKGKTYYFKVKAYKTVGGNKVYSSASKTVSVKIKK
ncbi:MAG: fibronectin type III domain-containing protein, partial [Clostridia bacterium]|nr:fibronectin type III domain-containing protein [Clostridia bacterium]